MNAPRCPHAVSGCNSPEGECAGLCMRRPYVPLPTITIKLPMDQAVAAFMALTSSAEAGQLGQRVRLARQALVKAIGESPLT